MATPPQIFQYDLRSVRKSIKNAIIGMFMGGHVTLPNVMLSTIQVPQDAYITFDVSWNAAVFNIPSNLENYEESDLVKNNVKMELLRIIRNTLIWTDQDPTGPNAFATVISNSMVIYFPAPPGQSGKIAYTATINAIANSDDFEIDFSNTRWLLKLTDISPVGNGVFQFRLELSHIGGDV